uniref:Uncharacterized protein n=1 Tax=Geobacter sp. (strain M21) TaxID=443144 RepID=C6E628_GEOSM
MFNLLRHTASPAAGCGLACSLALWYLLLAACEAVKPGWQALDLTSFRVWGFLLILNLVAGVAAAWRDKARLRLSLSLAALLLLIAAAYCYLFQFEGALSLAEGENYEPFPTSFSSGHKGLLAPFPQASFTLTRVEPDGKAGRAVIVQRGAGIEIDRDWRRIGAGEIRFKGSAQGPLVVVSSKEKGELERSYVKIDLEQGKEQSFEFDTLPYQFLLRKEKPKGKEQGLFHLEVRRGKMSLFDGVARLGQKVPVQGIEVAIEGERKFALLEMRTRRGLVVMQAAAALFALAAIMAIAVRIKGVSQG